METPHRATNVSPHHTTTMFRAERNRKMTKVDHTLRFPSGRTVYQLKKEVRGWVKTSTVTHAEAPNALAKLNGINETWHTAIGLLKLSRTITLARKSTKTLLAAEYISSVSPKAERREQRRSSPRIRTWRLSIAKQLYRREPLSVSTLCELYQASEEALRDEILQSRRI